MLSDRLQKLKEKEAMLHVINIAYSIRRKFASPHLIFLHIILNT